MHVHTQAQKTQQTRDGNASTTWDCHGISGEAHLPTGCGAGCAGHGACDGVLIAENALLRVTTGAVAATVPAGDDDAVNAATEVLVVPEDVGFLLLPLLDADAGGGAGVAAAVATVAAVGGVAAGAPRGGNASATAAPPSDSVVGLLLLVAFILSCIQGVQANTEKSRSR